MDDKVLYGYRPIRRQRGATLVRIWRLYAIRKTKWFAKGKYSRNTMFHVVRAENDRIIERDTEAEIIEYCKKELKQIPYPTQKMKGVATNWNILISRCPPIIFKEMSNGPAESHTEA